MKDRIPLYIVAMIISPLGQASLEVANIGRDPSREIAELLDTLESKTGHYMEWLLQGCIFDDGEIYGPTVETKEYLSKLAGYPSDWLPPVDTI